MKHNMPRTPFSTALSGAAKETEIRLKNIFSGPKKRPPLLFLVLVFSMCLFCGNLVSCQVSTAEEPDRSAPSRLSEESSSLLEALFRSAEQDGTFQMPNPVLLDSIEEGSRILGALFVEDHLENSLILGVMDKENSIVSRPMFRCNQHIGIPNVVTFRNSDGENCLLYTFNGQMNGQYRGEAGVVCFDGQDIVWKWPVEGDVRDTDSAAYRDYQDYWSSHLALLAPGGVDVYGLNPAFQWGQDEPASRWLLDHDENFYPDQSSSVELPMPIYFQSLRWLNDQTGDPGGWRILSLHRNEERCDPGRQMDCFSLLAHTDNGQNELTAELFFSYEQEGDRRSYDTLKYAEIAGEICGYPPAPDTQDEPAVTALEWTPDLNRNSIPEELRLTELDGGLRLDILENGTVIHSEEGYFAHAGYTSIFLCTLEGKDYLLFYFPTMYHGECSYSYQLVSLEKGAPTTVRENSIAFTINLDHPLFPDPHFDPEEIAAFMDEINDLLARSVQLLNTDADLAGTFQEAGRLVDTLWWLDIWDPVFTRNPGKSLLENLTDFQDAMLGQAGTG